MLTRSAVLLIGFVMAAPAAAEEMSFEQAHHFVIGKLFAVSCFDGTRAMGRIYSDGSVIGTVQFRATGPERTGGCRRARSKSRARPSVHRSRDCLLSPASSSTGLAIIASAPRCGASIQPIAISSAHLDSETDFARTDGRSTDGPLQLHPCTAGVKEQC